MPTEQLQLWNDPPQQGDNIKVMRDPIWYYIHNLVLDVMLVVDNDGSWDWVAHDTVNNTPHLYNNRKVAQLQCKRIGHGSVKIYPWKR